MISRLFTEQAARHTVDRIRGQLLPQVQFEASYSDRFDPNKFVEEQETTTVTGRVRVPIYENGEVYAAVRQAKHNHLGAMQDIEQSRSEVQAEVVTAWSQLMAVRAQI